MLRRVAFFFCLLLSHYQGYTQTCGCTECPVQTVDLTPGLIPIEVMGAVNDDLSSPTQGVCEVLMEFEHGDIGDMTIELWSPSGQRVMLVGEFTLCGFTGGNLWEVSFIPCAEIAAPDVGFSAVWDNCEFENTTNTDYTGSYYPARGCLENFDTGPVNGTWELRFRDNLLGSFGNIIDIEIVFCDMADISCETPLCPNTVAQVPSELIICNGEELLITEESSGSRYNHYWTTLDGNIIPPFNLPTMKTTTPGTYTVVISGPDLTTGLACSDTADVIVTRPEVDAGPDGILTCYDFEYEISGTSSDPINTTWSGPGIDPGEENILTQYVDLPGTYVLSYMPNDDCLITDTLIVTIDTVSPVVTVTIDPEFSCGDVDVTLSFTSDLPVEEHEWFGPGLSRSDRTANPLIVDEEGFYDLVVTAPNGCFTDAEIEVVITQAAITDTRADTINCIDSTVTLYVTQDTAGYIFNWTGPGIVDSIRTDAFPVVDVPGMYIATVSLNGLCPAVDTVTVVVDTIPPDVTVVQNDFTCNDTTVLIGLSPNEPELSIMWTGPGLSITNDTSYLIYVSQTGTYLATVTKESGCSSIYEIMVAASDDLPSLSTTTDTISCSNTPVVISASSDEEVSYLWTGPGINNTNDTLAHPSVTQPGSYTIVVTNDLGCASRATIVVEADTISPRVILRDTTLSCLAENVQIIAQEITADNFTWSGPGINSSNMSDRNPIVNQSGVYKINAVNNNGCARTDSMEINLLNDTPLISLSSDTLDCINLDVIINSTISGDVVYSWTGPGIMTDNDSVASPTVGAAGQYILTITTVQGCQRSDTILVEERSDRPEVRILKDTISCSIDNINLEFISADAIRYEWSGPDISAANRNDNSPLISIPGFYEIEVWNDAGCSNRTGVLIYGDTLSPMVSLNSDTITCANPLISINNTSDAVLYNWVGPGINASNTQDRSPLIDQAGTYEVTATGLNGCTTLKEIDVQIDTTYATATLQADTLTCTINSVELELNTNATSVLWTGPDISVGNEAEIKPMVSTPGVYQATLTSERGCVSTIAIAVQEDTISPILDLIADRTLLTCDNPTGILSGAGSLGKGELLFRWSRMNGVIPPDQENEAQISVTEPDIYTLFIIDTDNGCTSTESINITQSADFPTVAVDPYDVLTCFNVLESLTASSPGSQDPINYEWSGPGITTDPTQSQISVDRPGLYKVLITNSVTGCVKDTTIEVLENIDLPTAEAEVLGELTCIINEVALSVGNSSLGSNYELLWKGASINAANSRELNPSVSIPGNYTIIIRDVVNGCVDSAQVEVLENDAVLQPSDVFYQDPNCNDDNSGLIALQGINGGTPPYSIFMNGEPGENFYSELSSGQYILTITDQEGCAISDTIVLEQVDQLALELGDEMSIELGDEVILNPFYSKDSTVLTSIIWSGRDFFCDSCLVQRFSPFQSGTYSLQLIDEDGCEVVDDIFVRVARGRTAFIPNVFSPNGDALNDRLQVILTEKVAQVNDFRIFNRWGGMVYSEKDFTPTNPSTGWDGMHGDQLSAEGVYVYLLEYTLIDGSTIRLSGDFTLIR